MYKSNVVKVAVVALFTGYAFYFFFATLAGLTSPLMRIVGLLIALRLWEITGSGFLCWLFNGDPKDFKVKAHRSMRPFEYVIGLLTSTPPKSPP